MSTPPLPLSSVALLLWSADLTAPQRLATPFVMAQAAVALDLEVELYFVAESVRLLMPEAAGQLVGFGEEARHLGEHLQRTHDLGVTFFACSQALHAAGLTRAALTPLCKGLGGMVQFMGRCADPSWRTLVF